MTEPPPHTDAFESLVARFDGTREGPRRAPWTWSTLTLEERTALAEAIDRWVETYNHVIASEDDLIPPCWRRHPELAGDLAVMLWLWYGAHVHKDATVAKAAEYRRTYLPAFRSRVDQTLGASPRECRQGNHPRTWRRDAQILLRRLPDRQLNQLANAAAVEQLGDLHHGFPLDDT